MSVAWMMAGPSIVTEGYGAAGPTTQSDAQPVRSTSMALARAPSVEIQKVLPSRTK
jgi:hypothetical protein